MSEKEVKFIKHCPICHEDRPYDDIYCHVCGARLVERPYREPRCPNCDGKVKEYFTFCDHCGYRLKPKKLSDLLKDISLNLLFIPVLSVALIGRVLIEKAIIVDMPFLLGMIAILFMLIDIARCYGRWKES